MDGELIKKALCFHGKPMQKIWDDERGAGDLQVSGVPEDGNYSIYMERQKYFTFQDRAKRLKLHQFLARKAVDLYDKELKRIPAKPVNVELDAAADKNFVAVLPPYDTFLTKHQEKVKRYTLESIKTEDIVYGIITRGKTGTSIPLGVKLLCTDESDFKMLTDCNIKIKCMIPPQLCGTAALEKNGPGQIETNDYVRCEIVEFSIDAERMALSLEPLSDKNKNKKLGKITPDELPQLYGKLSTMGSQRYEEYLHKSKEIDNPNYDILYSINGLNVNDNFTFMATLKNGFPAQEYAKELRQSQASKWAFRSVADGIEYFKVGQHVEAFQCLNKALHIDPRNVEGLVARGALYANKGSFLKAVEDFEKALKLNAYHVNARKYMGETLVALGRSYEEDNRTQDAAKAYRDCLNIIPNHEQANMLLEAIQHKTGASVDILTMANIHPPNIFDLDTNKTTSSQASESEDSSSDSSSESEEEFPNIKKAGSLSPLSKKLALHAHEMESSRNQNQQFVLPFYMSQANPTFDIQSHVFANEFKLDEDDTESRVRKLLQEASKHKKDKKKTKKSKKSKKSKKASKSAKEARETNENQTEFKYVGGVHLLNAGNTLSANLKKYEKSIQELKRRQELLDHPSTSMAAAAFGVKKRQKSETPPPAPAIRSDKNRTDSLYQTIGFGKNSTKAQMYSSQPEVKEAHRFSFQIKKPVRMDKFGLVRLATPALQKSITPSPTRSLKKTGSRSRSRSRRYSRSYSRSRSRSAGRYRSRRYSRSRSSSDDRYGNRRRRRSYSRSRSRSTSASSRRRYRSPSPYDRNRRRTSSSPYSRSRSPYGGGYRGRGRGRGRGFSRGGGRGASIASAYGNRVWKKPDASLSPESKEPSSADGRWPHDKFENPSDDPTIEEIDEIISKAQKERKQNIINNDKNILKKPNKW